MNREPTPLDRTTLSEWIASTIEVDDRMRGKVGQPIRRPRLFALRHLLAPITVHRPLFVVGAPRSGTSLLGDLIGALPEFSYHYEPPIVKAAVRYLHEQRWNEKFARRVFRAIYSGLLERSGETHLRLAEKTPQNSVIVAFLARTFPDAQFLHIVRDGRDAALSYAEKPWLTEKGRKSGQRETGGYPFGPFARFWVEPDRRDEFESTSDLHRCIWAWRAHCAAARRDGSKLDAARWLEIRYEDLTAQPRVIGERILDFLSITASESRSKLLNALAKVRPDSVGRHRTALDGAGRAIIEQEAGTLLAALGYRTPAEQPT